MVSKHNKLAAAKLELAKNIKSIEIYEIIEHTQVPRIEKKGK